MDTQSSSVAPITTKKLCNKVKIAFYMLRKTLSKTKLLLDLHINLKDGKLARKAVTTLLLHHMNHTTATSNNLDTLFISPDQAHKLQSSTGASKCKSHQHHDHDKIGQVVSFEMSNDGGSAMVSHELTVNESPLREDEESQVDKAAEAFIKNFYNQLKQQHNITNCVESPSPNHLWDQ